MGFTVSASTTSSQSACGLLDPDPDAFLRDHRRRRRWLALLLTVGVLVPLTWLVVVQLQASSARRAARLTAEQKAALSASLDHREAVLRGRVETWNRAVAKDTLAALKPGTDECPITLPPPSQGSAAAYAKFATHDAAFGSWSMCLLRSGVDCARAYKATSELEQLRTRIAADDVYAWDLEQPAVEPESPAVLFVVETEVRPVARSPAAGRVSFTPGSIAGRGFVYSPELGRFVCSGEISVRNSKNVDIEVSAFGESATEQQRTAEYEARVALERDLDLHLRYSVQKAMRLLSP